MLSPCTTFANGINPFAAGNSARALFTHPTEVTLMQPPAKPARKNAKLIKDEDYSTPYQPPIDAVDRSVMRKDAPVVASSSPKVASAAAKVASAQRQFDSAAFVICDDPLPASRNIGPGKYDALFQQLGRGQAIKCPPDAVASTQHALRKWVKEQRVTGVLIKTCKDYGDGFGRVWLLAEPGQS
jgi:hypothetical protein